MVEEYEFQDVSSRLLCQMVMIDMGAKQWLKAEMSAFEQVQYVPDGEVLQHLVDAEFDPSTPHSVGSYLASLQKPIESSLAKLIIKPPNGNHFKAVQDAWFSIKRREVERRYREVERRLKDRGLEAGAMMDLLGELKVLKELLDRPSDGSDDALPSV